MWAATNASGLQLSTSSYHNTQYTVVKFLSRTSPDQAATGGSSSSYDEASATRNWNIWGGMSYVASAAATENCIRLHTYFNAFDCMNDTCCILQIFRASS
eukprot:486047-Pleurochrysis_carterae.AAC.2